MRSGVAAQLEVLYPRDPGDPERWPTPAEFNEPFPDARPASQLGERMRSGQAVELRRQVAYVPEKIGPAAPGPDEIPPPVWLVPPPPSHARKGITPMSLFERVKRAREIADASTDPADHALAHALESALDAEARAIFNAEREPVDTTGIPSAAEAGFPSSIHIPRPATEN
jgi:hypothetical protein